MIFHYFNHKGKPSYPIDIIAW